MSFFFLLNNLHFAAEAFGALIFAISAWFAFDALAIRRDFLTASRGIGFAILAVSQIMYALMSMGPQYDSSAKILSIVGLLFILTNLILEKPVDRPSLKAVGMLPGALILLYSHYITAVLYFLVALISYAQYRKETKEILKPFFSAFLLLSISALIFAVYGDADLDTSWIVARAFELLGFLSLARWVWQYLSARLREEVVVIFTSMSFVISIAVTLAFSMILIGQIQVATEANLLASTRVLDSSLVHREAELLAKARLLSGLPELQAAVSKNDFVALESLTTRLLEEENLNFITIADEDGYVLYRSQGLSNRTDSVSALPVVQKAFSGQPASGVEVGGPERLALRAAAPIFRTGTTTLGVVVVGSFLDSAFVDGLKKITGLDSTVLLNDTIFASTVLSSDKRTRIEGLKLTDQAFKSRVLGRGETIVGKLTIEGRPFIGSFLPVKDSIGNIVGALSTLRSQAEIVTIASRANLLTLVAVGVIMLILIIPLYVVTRRLEE